MLNAHFYLSIRAFAIPVSLSCLCLAPFQAHAQDEPRAYVGAAIETIELESFDSGGFDIFSESTTTAVIRGGVIFGTYFAVEGEAAIGVDNQDDDGIADYNSRFAGYGRARYPFGNTGLEIFARLGYATTDIDSSNVIGTGNQNGVTYGGGLAFNFGAEDKFQVRLDYTEFNFGNDQDADALAIGLGFNF